MSSDKADVEICQARQISELSDELAIEALIQMARRGSPGPEALDALADRARAAVRRGSDLEGARIVRIARASPIGDEEIGKVAIIVGEQIFDGGDAGRERMRVSRLRFERDARDIVTTLGGAVPGGTMDQLMIELLSRRASSLVVPASWWSDDSEVGEASDGDAEGVHDARVEPMR